MSFIDRLNSAFRFLTEDQRKAFAPIPSEQVVADLVRRMGIKLPGAKA